MIAFCANAQADVIKLAKGGQSDYTIVIGSDCSPSERYGAEELQMFLEQICGAELPISTQPAVGPMVLLGRSKALDGLSVDIDFESLGDEGLVIKTDGQHLVLAGGGKRGTLYAVYEFLDKYLDCRWFTATGGPTPAVSRIPRRETIELPLIDYRRIPALEYRETNYREACRDADWAARNRLNSFHCRFTDKHGGKGAVYKSPPGYAHTFKRLVNRRLFKEHPEWFALINGKRVPHGQPCLTNPDVAAHVIGGVRNRLSQSGANVVSVSQNDGQTHYCRCDKCTALAEYEGSQAGPIIHFVNKIADNIKDDYPDVAINSLAYGYTRKPPKHVRPRSNVIVQYASSPSISRAYKKIKPDGSFYIQLPPVVPDRLEDFVTWSNICQRPYVWHYAADFDHYLAPYPNLCSIGPHIKFFADHNVKGIFAQGDNAGGGEFAELRSYLLARLMWNPECDWEREMDVFLQAYYGPAAGPISRYIRLLHEWPETTEEMIIDGRPHISSELVTRAEPLFDEAEAAVADDPVLLLRVRKEQLGIIYIKLSAWQRFFPGWPEHAVALDKFALIAHRYGISKLKEGRDSSLDKNLEQWRQDVDIHKKAGKISKK